MQCGKSDMRFRWLLFLICVCLSKSVTANDRSVQAGDQVVTTVATNVKKGSMVVAPLPVGTQFEVKQVKDSWLLLRQEIDGNSLYGWVSGKDILPVPPDQLSLYASEDEIDPDQFQMIELPRRAALTFTVRSDQPVDLMVVTATQRTLILGTPQSIHRGIRPKQHLSHVQDGTLEWKPRNRRKHYLVIENGQMVAEGADSRAVANFAVTCSIEKTHSLAVYDFGAADRKQGPFTSEKYRSAFPDIDNNELEREPTPLQLLWVETMTDCTVRFIVQMFGGGR